MHSKSAAARFAAMALVSALLGTVCQSAHAITTTINGSSDANITAGVVNSSSPAAAGLITNVFSNTRAIIEFSPATLPGNAVIDSINFKFDIISVANQTSAVDLMGFADNGTIVSGDATAAGSLLGSYNAVSLGLGNHSASLTTSLLQSLVGGSQFLALRMQSASDDTNTGIASIEQGSFFSAPTLEVVYHVPEPTSLATLSIGALSLLRRRQRA